MISGIVSSTPLSSSNCNRPSADRIATNRRSLHLREHRFTCGDRSSLQCCPAAPRCNEWRLQETPEVRMPTPEMSDTTTQGVRVGAAAFFLPDQSDPAENKYLFGYTIVIANQGDSPVQLVSRHWVIIDGNGEHEEVRGPGVVGETPRLEPGQAFKYQSFCPLPTPWGTMEGTYRMR